MGGNQNRLLYKTNNYQRHGSLGRLVTPALGGSLGEKRRKKKRESLLITAPFSLTLSKHAHLSGAVLRASMEPLGAGTRKTDKNTGDPS